MLPSVGSLEALRSHARTSRADRPYLGVGNPLRTGNPSNPENVQLAAQAVARQACQAPGNARFQQVAAARGLTGDAGAYFRGALADLDQLQRLSPLPETTDELCAVGRSLKAAVADILLGSSASERRIKEFNASDRLSHYRIIHFATHGLMGGERGGAGEPALVLTPPATSTEEDDGLLTASEVSGLKLDADWVILSACNTAAGDKLGGEAMSGLARAFFYAGARALLVSHWYVDSETTVTLTTRMFAELERRPGLSRSEALRIAMNAMIAKAASARRTLPCGRLSWLWAKDRRSTRAMSGGIRASMTCGGSVSLSGSDILSRSDQMEIARSTVPDLDARHQYTPFTSTGRGLPA